KAAAHPSPDRGLGTTSAYAEKSLGGIVRARGERNYLRVRGEKLRVGVGQGSKSELPPRTRRKDGPCFI
ncbi:hypothetical protein, partial [Corynebacterium ulcerans]|uniref:hypothetical protein n=1 Tax=Corynebacterium ulcerans TaxID=65058 RepID=UPI001C12722F